MGALSVPRSVRGVFMNEELQQLIAIPVNEKEYTNYTRCGVSPQDFNWHLEHAKSACSHLSFREPPEDKPMLRWITYIKLGYDKVELWYNYGKKNYYVFTYLDGRPIYTTITGGEVWRRYKRFYWTEGDYNPNNARWNEEDDQRICAKAKLWYNETYTGQRIDDCYGYDINSAYTSIILNEGWIDTTHCRFNAKIGEGEIGMDYDEEEGVKLRHKGRAMFVFKRVPTPKKIKDWMLRVYKEKQEASEKLKDPNLSEADKFKYMKQKIEAKAILNYWVGCFQNYDPFIRAWIVCNCNEYITSLLDDNSLVCNTDSIVSKTKRPDIEKLLGDGIGKWKLEHTGQFAYRGLTYQWGYEVPTYRGIPKVAFKGKFDILTMPAPELDLLWAFDKTTLTLILR